MAEIDPQVAQGKEKVAVIGSGFGGLCAAARLASEGFDVTIVEMRDKPGGRAYVYEQDGFVFDAGPTVITAPECLEEVFAAAGEKLSDHVELLPVKPLYRLCWEDGLKFDYSSDLNETLTQIEKISPQDVAGYRKFLKYTENVFQRGYTELAHVPFLKVWSMFKVAPHLVRLKAYRSVYSRVSQFLKDPHLREAFSFHSLLVGGNPFGASAIYTLIHYLERKWGVFFPKGGTHALVRALVALVERKGGRIRYNQPVRQIRVADSRVQGLEYANGEFEAFDRVVSNADVHTTYTKLLSESRAARSSKWFVRNARYSMSLFVLYFGTNKKYPEIAHHTILFGKRYKELLDDIFHAGVLADDFSLYLHSPTVSDPDLAPEGCAGFYVLSPVPHLGKANIDWKEVGPKYADKIIDYLEKHQMPGLRESIVTQRIFHPGDFQQQLQAHMGSAFSLEPVLWQSAYFRIHNRDPHIEGLYFVGAGTHPGAGIPGVVNSAKATAGLVVADRQGVDLVEIAKRRISKGSLSFSLAAKLFPRQLHEAACLLYLWCRHCDDSIDDTRSKSEAAIRLEQLQEQTQKALRGQTGLPAPFEAVRRLKTQYLIPDHYFIELLEGMRMDTLGYVYRTPEDLFQYCYRVAGCVGLIMTHIMKLSSDKALRHACDLGVGMQLTNIARDVAEDAGMGRVYFPAQWLDQVGIESDSLLKEDNRIELVGLVERLLREADRRYASAREGLKYLPLRAAFAVAAAASVYSEIGTLVRERGAAAWETRSIVGKTRKLYALARGVCWVLASLPSRWREPWREVKIATVWRHA